MSDFMMLFLFQFEAYSLLSEEHTENTLGFEHLKDLSSVEFVVIDRGLNNQLSLNFTQPQEIDERDFKVKILTWKDSDKGFVKQVSSGGFSN